MAHRRLRARRCKDDPEPARDGARRGGRRPEQHVHCAERAPLCARAARGQGCAPRARRAGDDDVRRAVVRLDDVEREPRVRRAVLMCCSGVL
ncbi:hypothetical protein PsYK624_088580 [Phanerochaete sordida]|uniref:Uncharacterized protein n=1 Tax=Phanerochaete sordida TaxID=48140 RepID=A0A9P3GDG9_9APHY|nr:hypothetical protein PsYK624_088580 [Phanerochaete sordida]